MTSKERLLCALNLGKPDRVPVTIHQWQKYHLDKYMGGISDIEAFRMVGLDASITIYPFYDRESIDWKIEKDSKNAGEYIEHSYKVITPKGNLTYKMGQNAMTTWEIEHIIKNDGDVELLKYRPIPYADKTEYQKAYDKLADSGILRTFVCGSQGGCWQEACNLVGTEELILKTFDDPAWVHNLLNILLNQKLEFIDESMTGIKVDLIETGGGASSNTVISPNIHREFCMPYDKKIHNAIKNIGHKTVYHTCGGMTKITDLILENGCDASETLSPQGVGGDIVTDDDANCVINAFKGKIAMIGGLDQFNILTTSTPKMIRDEVVRLFNLYGKDGGYIMSASDHFFDVSKENLKTYGDAAKYCNY